MANLMPDDRGALACMVSSEIGTVLAVMRRNNRSTSAGTDETSLTRGLKRLRRDVFLLGDPRDISFYLSPFLDLICSDQTTAPVTGVALSAVYKLLSLNACSPEAVRRVVQSVTKCRFEVTDPASEELVLMKILQVLLACMRNPASELLCDHDVCLLVHTCFCVVHQAAAKGELLQRTARHTMHEIMRAIFARLPHLNDGNGQALLITESKPALGNSIGNVHGNDAHMLDIGTSSNGDGNGNDTGNGDGEMEPYGVAGIIDIFRYLCSLLNIVDSAMVSGQTLLTIDEDIPLFALGLINSSIEIGGQTFGSYPELLSLVQDDLFRCLMQLGLSMNPLILSMVCSVVLNLYHHLRTHLKLQLEAFFSCVILRLTQGKFGSIYQQQEVAMEALVDFCRRLDFMPEMYANFDCDITCGNIFEDLINLLSKSAFPVNCPLSAMNILALDGLIAVIHSIAERVDVMSSLFSLNQSNDGEEAAQDYKPFWTDKCSDYKDPNCWVEFAKWQKHVKRKLMIGANHFNRDPKKGLEFLQGIRLLPDRLDPQSVAFVFRYTIGLDKSLLGEFLGDPEEFHLQVLTEFTQTFDFRGMSLDMALRVYLETFRLPGEAQKIQRVLEAFAERYYEQSPQILANEDTVFILAYSLILLNTDQHKSQVRWKMSEEDFIKNNRSINAGQDLPREYLSELYHSIVRNEIKMSYDKGAGFLEMTPNRWIGLLCKSQEVAPYITYDRQPFLDHSMFSVISGPAIAAISVVFDHSKDNEVLRTCVEGFIAVAKISASYHIEDAVDDLVVSLCKFTTLLNPTASAEEAIRAFGDGTKAHLACKMVFNIVSKYGDSVQIGWRSIVDCILRLHKLGLLLVRGAMSDALDGGDNANVDIEGMSVVPPPGTRRRTPGLIGRFSQLLLLEAEEPRSQSTEWLASHRHAQKTVEACCIHNIFTESKFLQADSLLYLARALVWAARRSQKGDEEDAAVVCLELLMNVTLNNRDRIMLLWPVTSEHIAGIIQTTAAPSLVLVEKAVFALFHICQRLLPYKEDLSEELLSSLQLILKLDVSVAEVLCERIAQEVMQLVRANAGHIKLPVGWVAISSLLSITACHPKASATGFEALSFLMAKGMHVTMDNFMLFLDAACAFANARVGGEERSLQALNLIVGSAQCLITWSYSSERAERREKELGKCWIKLVDGLKRACLDPREKVRNHAILSLTTSLSTADRIMLSVDMLAHCIQDIVFGLLDNLLYIVLVHSPEEYQNMEISLYHAMKLLSKVFLQYLDRLALLPTFCALWLGVLDLIEKYFKAKIQGKYSEKIRELIPELLKNMFLILHAKGVLIQRSDKSNDSLWEMTWQHAEKISPSLQGDLFPEIPSKSNKSKQVDYISEQSITERNFVSSPVAEEDQRTATVEIHEESQTPR